MSRDYTLEDAHRGLQAQAKTISTVTGEFERHNARLLVLEEANHARNVREGREDERDKALNARLEKIEKAIKGIQGVDNKLVWLVGAGIVTAFLAFVVNGGLKV